MKTKSIVGMVAGLMLAFASVSVSASMPDLPIGGRDQLREYALDTVVRGFRDVESPSLVRIKGEPVYVEVSGDGAEDVLNKLLAEQINFDMVNISDKITGRVWLYNANGRLVFYGQSQYTPATVGKAGPNYNVWMQSISLPIYDVASAEILVLNEDGQTTRTEQVRIENGQPIFQEWMAGAVNGVLSVRLDDGSVYKFDLWNPVATGLATISESGASWQIPGHHVIPASSAPELLVNFVEAWELPTVLLEVDATQLVKLDVLGMVTIDGRNMFERPIGVIFTQVDGPLSGAGPLSEIGPSTIKLPGAGKYRVRFEWKNFGQSNTLYSGPVVDPVDGGKGF
jgi:hypothetical protein